jgi:hypothetical protein
MEHLNIPDFPDARALGLPERHPPQTGYWIASDALVPKSGWRDLGADHDPAGIFSDFAGGTIQAQHFYRIEHPERPELGTLRVSYTEMLRLVHGIAIPHGFESNAKTTDLPRKGRKNPWTSHGPWRRRSWGRWGLYFTFKELPPYYLLDHRDYGLIAFGSEVSQHMACERVAWLAKSWNAIAKRMTITQLRERGDEMIRLWQQHMDLDLPAPPKAEKEQTPNAYTERQQKQRGEPNRRPSILGRAAYEAWKRRRELGLNVAVPDDVPRSVRVQVARDYLGYTELPGHGMIS